MKLLFKPSNTGGTAAKVSDSNFKEHYAGINASTAWKTLLPSIKRATRDNLIPYISQELYDGIAELYDSAGSLTGEQTEFLDACQDVVAYFAIVGLSPELNVGIGDMGIVEKGSNQQPVMPVAQWRYKEFKYDLYKKADEYLDRVLELLEQYVHDGVDEFMQWTDSEAYKEARTNFFNSASQFSKYININRSRRLFNQLETDILRAEEKIDSVIGTEQFNALVTAIGSGDSLTGPFIVLVDRIRRYVAAAAVSTCTPRLFVTMDVRGLTLSSYTDGFDASNHFSSSFRGAEAVDGYIQQQKSDSDSFFQDLVNFVYDNIDYLPLIKESSAYEENTNASYCGVISSGPGAGFL